MTQITKEEIKKRLEELEGKLSPEEKLAVIKELNVAISETNNAVSSFVDTVKENTLKKEINSSLDN